MQDIAARAGVVPSVLYDHSAPSENFTSRFLKSMRAVERNARWRRLEGTSAEQLLAPASRITSSSSRRTPFIWRVLHQDTLPTRRSPPSVQEIADRGTAAVADLIRFGAGKRQIAQGHHSRRRRVDPLPPRNAIGRPTASPDGGTKIATCRVSAWSNSVLLLLWQGFEGMLIAGFCRLTPRRRSCPGSTPASLRWSTGRCRGNYGRPQRLWRAPCRQGRPGSSSTNSRHSVRTSTASARSQASMDRRRVIQRREQAPASCPSPSGRRR